MVSIDATGSVVKPPAGSQFMDGSTQLKHVFFYSIMMKTNNKSVPIAQMLSQDQTSEFIGLFLQKTFKNIRQPLEIVSDESKALLKAITTSFTDCRNIKQYVTKCMAYLLHGSALTSCFIRIDRSHFIKNITIKINYRDYRKKNFFRCIIGFLIQCASFEVVKKVISDFFALILSEYDGYDENGCETPAEGAKKRLLGLTSSHNEEVDYASNDIKTEEDTDLNFNLESNWIDEIIENITISKSNGSHENLYYTPNEKKMFTEILASIVLWSNVLKEAFGSTAETATSSDIESYFKSVKRGLLQNKVVRADEFIEQHIAFVNSEIKLNAMAKTTVPSEITTQRKRSNSFEEKSPRSKGK